jgi:hypothetical protein
MYIAWFLFQIAIVIHFFGPMERIDPNSLHPLIKHPETEMACVRSNPEAGVLDEPDSAKPAQQSSYNGPPDNIGWTQFKPM